MTCLNMRSLSAVPFVAFLNGSSSSFSSSKSVRPSPSVSFLIALVFKVFISYPSWSPSLSVSLFSGLVPMLSSSAFVRPSPSGSASESRTPFLKESETAGSVFEEKIS